MLRSPSSTPPTGRNISSIPSLMGAAQPPPHQALGDWPQPRNGLQPAKVRFVATSTAISISGRAAQTMTGSASATGWSSRRHRPQKQPVTGQHATVHNHYLYGIQSAPRRKLRHRQLGRRQPINALKGTKMLDVGSPALS